VKVAGKAESPSTRALGDTFSSFKRWETMAPEQHVAAVRKTIARWRKHNEK
jgi:hypothetical protein